MQISMLMYVKGLSHIYREEKKNHYDQEWRNHKTQMYENTLMHMPEFNPPSLRFMDGRLRRLAVAVNIGSWISSYVVQSSFMSLLGNGLGCTPVYCGSSEVRVC